MPLFWLKHKALQEPIPNSNDYLPLLNKLGSDKTYCWTHHLQKTAARVLYYGSNIL